MEITFETAEKLGLRKEEFEKIVGQKKIPSGVTTTPSPVLT